MQRTDSLELGGDVNGAHQVGEKEIHGWFRALEFWQRRKQRTHQNVAVGVIALERGITFAGRHSSQFQFDGAHHAFRKVRRIVVLQVGREPRRAGGFFKQRFFYRNHVRITQRQGIEHEVQIRVAHHVGGNILRAAEHDGVVIAKISNVGEVTDQRLNNYAESALLGWLVHGAQISGSDKNNLRDGFVHALDFSVISRLHLTP